MTNNTLFCGIALVVIGLSSYFMDTPNWDGKVNQFLDAHDAAVDKHPEAKKEKADAPEPLPNKKEADLADARPNKKTHRRGPASPTSLIPAGLGALLLVVVGIVIYKPNLRKHAMHVGALVGVAAIAGGIYALTGGMSEFGELNDPKQWANPTLGESWLNPLKPTDKPSSVSMWDQPKVRSGALTALVGIIFTVLAVKSFIDARKARTAATPAQ